MLMHTAARTAVMVCTLLQQVVYPLSNRGVVLLRGTNCDESASDSNGAG
jgi:hypothetical protein